LLPLSVQREEKRRPGLGPEGEASPFPARGGNEEKEKGGKEKKKNHLPLGEYPSSRIGKAKNIARFSYAGQGTGGKKRKEKEKKARATVPRPVMTQGGEKGNYFNSKKNFHTEREKKKEGGEEFFHRGGKKM